MKMFNFTKILEITSIISCVVIITKTSAKIFIKAFFLIISNKDVATLAINKFYFQRVNKIKVYNLFREIYFEKNLALNLRKNSFS